MKNAPLAETQGERSFLPLSILQKLFSEREKNKKAVRSYREDFLTTHCHEKKSEGFVVPLLAQEKVSYLEKVIGKY